MFARYTSCFIVQELKFSDMMIHYVQGGFYFILGKAFFLTDEFYLKGYYFK